MKVLPLVFLSPLVAVLLAGCGSMDRGMESSAAAAPAPSGNVSSLQATRQADRERSDITPYPLDTCAVINKPLNGRPKHRRVYKGQEVLFCCTPCVYAFDTNPEPYMPRILAAAEASRNPGTLAAVGTE